MSVNEVKLKKAANKFQIRGTGPNTSRTFAIGDEDHTLGNALRHVLISNAGQVEFAGYSVPHPSEPVVNIRVQAKAPTTAIEALQESCDTLQKQCQFVLEALEDKLPEIKQDRIQLDEKLKTMMQEGDEDEEEEEVDVQDGGDDDDEEDPMEE